MTLFSDSDSDYIIKMYPDNKTKEIADHLGFTVAQISSKANQLMVSKSKAFFEIHSSRFKKGSQNGVEYRFKKGQKGTMAGVKMSNETKAKLSTTFFKKGNTPYNKKQVGYEIDRRDYLYIKTHSGKFKSKQRVVWESVNGPVPEKHRVIFLDGNKRNFDISNLELISNKESMERNTIARFPIELRKVINSFHKLNRSINERNKK